MPKIVFITWFYLWNSGISLVNSIFISILLQNLNHFVFMKTMRYSFQSLWKASPLQYQGIVKV